MKNKEELKITTSPIWHEFNKENPPKKGKYKVVLYGKDKKEIIANYIEIKFVKIGSYHCWIYNNDLITNVRLWAKIED